MFGDSLMRTSDRASDGSDLGRHPRLLPSEALFSNTSPPMALPSEVLSEAAPVQDLAPNEPPGETFTT